MFCTYVLKKPFPVQNTRPSKHRKVTADHFSLARAPAPAPGPTRGLVSLLAGPDGTPEDAANRLEQATLASGVFHCKGCNAKCCLACTVRRDYSNKCGVVVIDDVCVCLQEAGVSLGETTAFCPLCAEQWPAERRTDYLLETAADRRTVVSRLRATSLVGSPPPSIMDMHPRVDAGWDIFGCGPPNLTRVAGWLWDLEPSARRDLESFKVSPTR